MNLYAATMIIVQALLIAALVALWIGERLARQHAEESADTFLDALTTYRRRTVFWCSHYRRLNAMLPKPEDETTLSGWDQNYGVETL